MSCKSLKEIELVLFSRISDKYWFASSDSNRRRLIYSRKHGFMNQFQNDLAGYSWVWNK